MSEIRMPSAGYRSLNEVKRDVSYYLMNDYNWERQYQFNNWLSLAKAEESAKKVPVRYSRGAFQ